MKKAFCYIISFLLTAIAANTCYAQSDLYIPQGGSVFFHPGDTASIFGNITVDGTLGTKTGSRIIFFGSKWHTGINAFSPDESANGTSAIGGSINFQQPNPLYGNFGTQIIHGNYNAAFYNGTTYPSISLNNIAGLLIDSADLFLRQSLQFTTGKVYLNGYSLVVGNNDVQGAVTGYNQNNFVVTGINPMGGFLYMHSMAGNANKVVFPIGTTDVSYTPLAITNYGKTDYFRTRVFDKVYDGGLFGNDISSSSVNKTWIVANSDTLLNADVELQHNIPDEGAGFIPYRQVAFVSRFVNNAWDTAGPFTTPKQPGELTTGAGIANAGTNTRLFNSLPGTAYLYTKFSKIQLIDRLQDVLIFSAERLTPILAKLDWTFRPEQANNVVYYTVEKRIAPNLNWTTVDTVFFSPQNLHHYSWFDNDVFYENPISYRIKVYSSTGSFFYSDIRTIPGVTDFYHLVYPNPTTGIFFLRLRDLTMVDKVQFYDMQGRKLFEERITNVLTKFDISSLNEAGYLLVLISKDNRKLYVEKVLKLNSNVN